MLYREIIADCSQIHTKPINTLCGQNIDLLNVKLVVHVVTTGLYWVKWQHMLVSWLPHMLNCFLKWGRCDAVASPLCEHVHHTAHSTQPLADWKWLQAVIVSNLMPTNTTHVGRLLRCAAPPLKIAFPFGMSFKSLSILCVETWICVESFSDIASHPRRAGSSIQPVIETESYILAIRAWLKNWVLKLKFVLNGLRIKICHKYVHLQWTFGNITGCTWMTYCIYL